VQKGFGAETPDLQTKLEDFFEAYGRTNAVRMRRSNEKEFKVASISSIRSLRLPHARSQGSVFVEFADFDSVSKFLDADPKPSWNGEALLIMTKYAYLPLSFLALQHNIPS
jgi:lupus La protein